MADTQVRLGPTPEQIAMDDRGWVELAHAPAIDPAALPARGWPVGAELKVLSISERTGALTGELLLPPGYRRPAGHYATQVEWLVLEGAVRVGGTVRGVGYYEFNPAGGATEALVCDQGVKILFLCRARPDFVPAPAPQGTAGRIQLDSEAMPWQGSHIPGPPPGIILKLLRHVPETNEMTWICANPPRWDYPMLEYHDCIEELYLIEGDIWLGNCGTMLPGSYLWRPPFITHGPFYSRTGAVLFGWVPSLLVNHFPDDPRRTVEENIANYEQKQRAAAAGGS
jgi:hypothetical protein